MDVHLRQLRYFAAVAEEGNFGRAAARLHVAQPTLSQQIAALERQLRTRLLERDHRGARVTPAGARLLSASQEMLASWQAAEAAIAELIASQRLRVDIWSEYHGWQEILGDIAAADPALAPEIGMRRSTRAAVEALLHEEIDLAIAILSGIALPAGLDSTLVRIRPCGLLVSSRHRFAARDAVPCAELDGTPIRIAPNTPAEVGHAFRSLAARFGAVPVDGGLNLGLLHALEMFARNPELALVFPLGANLPPGADARVIPLTDPEPCMQWSLIWRSGDGNPRLTALLRVLAKLSAEEGWLAFDPGRQWLLVLGVLVRARLRGLDASRSPG